MKKNKSKGSQISMVNTIEGFLLINTYQNSSFSSTIDVIQNISKSMKIRNLLPGKEHVWSELTINSKPFERRTEIALEQILLSMLRREIGLQFSRDFQSPMLKISPSEKICRISFKRCFTGIRVIVIINIDGSSLTCGLSKDNRRDPRNIWNLDLSDHLPYRNGKEAGLGRNWSCDQCSHN